MDWFKKIFSREDKQEDLELQENDNVFRATRLERELRKPNYIVCNGEEVEIEWDQVIRFDKTGPSYEPNNYRSKKKRKPQMLVAHWDACLSTSQMIDVTKKRGLSVHFGIDNDGTIFQLLDTKEVAWHAKGINTKSIGVEIANPVKIRYNKRYKDKGQQPRTPVYGDVIHGKEVTPYLDFYPVQVEAFKALARAVCKAHNIPFLAPLDRNGKLIRGVDKRVAGRSFKGIVGHYHSTARKTDPGHMPLDIIAKELSEEE